MDVCDQNPAKTVHHRKIFFMRAMDLNCFNLLNKAISKPICN